MNLWTLTLLGLALAGSVSPALAQTPWPDFMGQLRPLRSSSPNRAELPRDVRITPPDATVPPEKAAWSGNWGGWACSNAACETRLAVERVDGSGATVVYAFASDRQRANPVRVEASWSEGELRAQLPGGGQITYRMRPDRNLDFLYTSGAQRPVAGLLAKDLAGEHITTRLVEDGKPVRLELLIRKPQGTGPFPTVVFHHGSTGRGDNPDLFRHSWSSAAAASFFVERGWMVIFPQRRGRGASDGQYDEGFEPDRSRYACQPKDSLPGVDRAIQDIDAVMEHLRARPDVLQSRVLLAGQSRGGVLAIAYAGERPDPFIGVINFVGGWVGERCQNAVPINTETFKRGAKFPRPTLWLYGESDPFYSLSHSKGNFEAFVAAGGKGRFASYPVPGQNAGHAVLSHPRLWTEEVGKYLESVASPR